MNPKKYSEKDDLIFKGKCIQDVLVVLDKVFEKKKIAFGISDIDIFSLANDVINKSGFITDIIQCAESDPAAKGSREYVYKSYKGIRALRYYRIAKTIWESEILKNVDKSILTTIVRNLCEDGKVETGIDIHPFAQIGEGCVIDHGVGTKITTDLSYEGDTVVIGETTIIGDYCTILNDVVIGAADVNQGASKGKRHPTIGNHVTICAGVKILGNIKIGNNVFIGPGCRVVQDIPDDTKVVIVNQLQIMKRKGQPPLLLDGVVYDGKYLRLYGENIEDVDIKIVNDQYIDRTDLQVIVIERSKNYVAFDVIKLDCSYSDQAWKNNHIQVFKDNEYFFITSDVIERFLKRTNKPL